MEKRKDIRRRKREAKIKKNIKYTGHIFLWIIFLLVAVIIFQSIQLKRQSEYIPNIMGHTYLNVLSDSMSPKFKKYDLIIGKIITPAENLKINDVVTYKYGKMLVTHRIVEIDNDRGLFKTKGDANELVDEGWLSLDQVVSLYKFSIPKLGFIISKLQDFEFLAIIWVLVMYIIIKTIFEEVKLGKKTIMKK